MKARVKPIKTIAQRITLDGYENQANKLAIVIIAKTRRPSVLTFRPLLLFVKYFLVAKANATQVPYLIIEFRKNLPPTSGANA